MCDGDAFGRSDTKGSANTIQLAAEGRALPSGCSELLEQVVVGGETVETGMSRRQCERAAMLEARGRVGSAWMYEISLSLREPSIAMRTARAARGNSV